MVADVMQRVAEETGWVESGVEGEVDTEDKEYSLSGSGDEF